MQEPCLKHSEKKIPHLKRGESVEKERSGLGKSGARRGMDCSQRHAFGKEGSPGETNWKRMDNLQADMLSGGGKNIYRLFGTTWFYYCIAQGPRSVERAALGQARISLAALLSMLHCQVTAPTLRRRREKRWSNKKGRRAPCCLGAASWRRDSCGEV